MKAPVGLLSRRPVCKANAACLARQGHSDFEARDPRIKGCSPLIIPKQKSKRKNASRFAKRIFRASPIRRPLSRCATAPRRGASAPSPSPSVTPLPKGEARSTPIMPLAPFQKSDKKRSLHGLGSPFGRAGAKRLRGLISPLTTRFLDGAILPQGSERQQMQFIATTPSREKVTPKSPRLRSNESPSGAFKRQNGLALARWRGFAPTSSAGFSELLIIKIFFR